MTKFKKGDKVICISPPNENLVELFKVYTVSEALTHMVRISEVDRMLLNDRFMLLSEYRKKKIKSIYE